MTQLHESAAVDAAPKGKGAEVFVGICFFLSVLATIGLAVTYWVGGQPQVEGILLFVTLGGIGIGMVA